MYKQYNWIYNTVLSADFVKHDQTKKIKTFELFSAAATFLISAS